MRWIALSPEPIRDADLAELRAAVSTDADGAIVTFLGVTRESPGTPAPGQEAEAERFAGQRVVGLDYEAYESMALVVLEAIADEIATRFGVHRLAILHRVGAVAVGETSVAIAVAAAHRGAAFDACRYAIEELKARAPIWKSERFADGSVWLGAPLAAGHRGVGRCRDGRDAREGECMKVYVSVDMEGIAGVSHPSPTGRADRDYPAAVELMIGEANAAVEGALGRRRDRGRGQRLAWRHVQPDAREGPSGGAAGPGPEAVQHGRGGRRGRLRRGHLRRLPRSRRPSARAPSPTPTAAARP